MAEVYEPVQLIVDNLVLSGLEANIASANAVSKAYVGKLGTWNPRHPQRNR